MDIKAEIQKKNTELACVLVDQTQLVGYMVFCRRKKTVLLHKLCVLPEYRRKGVARLIISHLKKLSRDSDELVLWVDDSREAARQLYFSTGFSDLQKVTNYYGPGRDAFRMSCSFGT
ncbi:MAG: hypothetical protein M1814_001732 [Vezdaea aestivalis]|nr:MAG: hypothetical protein M1814_001732 [Vezdaea aestivalis]